MFGTTLDEVPRFITKTWVEVHDQSGSVDDRYKPSKQIRFKRLMLRSDLYDVSDAYIVVEGEVTVTGGSNSSRKNWHLAFRNNIPFTNYISKINNVLIDNAEDVDIVMPMYNLKITKKSLQR